MKAWRIDTKDGEGLVLVFAETRERAKYMAKGNPYDYEYTDMRATRAPDWDRWADEARVVMTNDDLPDGAPGFYSDEDDWGGW